MMRSLPGGCSLRNKVKVLNCQNEIELPRIHVIFVLAQMSLCTVVGTCRQFFVDVRQ